MNCLHYFVGEVVQARVPVAVVAEGAQAARRFGVPCTIGCMQAAVVHIVQTEEELRAVAAPVADTVAASVLLQQVHGSHATVELPSCMLQAVHATVMLAAVLGLKWLEAILLLELVVHLCDACS